MTIIRVGLHHGKSQTMEIDKPYNEIRADDIWAKDIHGITGWVDVEEEARQLRWQLRGQSDRIDELKAHNNKLKSEVVTRDGTLMGSQSYIDYLKGELSDCKKQIKMEIATVDHLDVMLTEERKGNDDWLWNKYNRLTRMVLESDITGLEKDQTITRLERQLDKCMTRLSEYDAALKECNEIVVEKNRVIDMTSAELHNCKFDKGELKADFDENSVRNNDLIKQYLLDQKEMEKLDCEIKELHKERDGYKESIGLERIDHVAEREATTRKQNATIRSLTIAKDQLYYRCEAQGDTIEEQKAVITVMSGGKTIANRDKRIKDLEYDLLICKGINTAHNIHTAGLKKALALHEESSKTLTKVVDIVNDDTISSIEAMCEISNVVMRAKQ